MYLLILKVTADPQDLPVTKSSESYIWPVCLPKDDDDEEFSSAGEMDQSKASIQVTWSVLSNERLAFRSRDLHYPIKIQVVVTSRDLYPLTNTLWTQYFFADHPNKKTDTVNAMLAGWLDAPPISQAFTNILGSSLSEADVQK